ncbi:hypothetical protein L600_002900000240 [Isoptericola variabilis J7]|nr:hypothetical protein L600_002900000240 [Isoptericola variabilis J7]
MAAGDAGAVASGLAASAAAGSAAGSAAGWAGSGCSAVVADLRLRAAFRRGFSAAGAGSGAASGAAGGSAAGSSAAAFAAADRERRAGFSAFSGASSAGAAFARRVRVALVGAGFSALASGVGPSGSTMSSSERTPPAAAVSGCVAGVAGPRSGRTMSSTDGAAGAGCSGTGGAAGAGCASGAPASDRVGRTMPKVSGAAVVDGAAVGRVARRRRFGVPWPFPALSVPAVVSDVTDTLLPPAGPPHTCGRRAVVVAGCGAAWRAPRTEVSVSAA